MIWNESIECMDRESLRKIQSIRLKKIVEHVYHNTPFYRKKMQELGNGYGYFFAVRFQAGKKP